jgi:riboflavin synthase alpha subunit
MFSGIVRDVGTVVGARRRQRAPALRPERLPARGSDAVALGDSIS